MKSEKNKKKKRISPALAFVFTFVSVLVIGGMGMLGYCAITGRLSGESVEEQEENVPKTDEETQSAFAFLWEAIPQEETMTEEEEDTSRYGALLADEEAMKAGNVYAMPNREEGVVSLGFAGDVLLDDEYAVMANLLNRGVTIENGISEETLTAMRDVDILMLNNEFPYTDRGTPLEGKTYTFRADTDAVGYLEDMGVDIVSLANNHCYDFGEAGLLDTLVTLEEAGMPYVGAGRNLEEAVRREAPR